MNAIEFAKQYRRMCNSYNQCCNEKECCPLTGDRCDIGDKEADIAKIVNAVEKWAKEHSIKMHQSEDGFGYK